MLFIIEFAWGVLLSFIAFYGVFFKLKLQIHTQKKLFFPTAAIAPEPSEMPLLNQELSFFT